MEDNQKKSEEKTLNSLFGKWCVFREEGQILNVLQVSKVALFEQPNSNKELYNIKEGYNMKFLGVANLEVPLGEGTYEATYDVSGYANVKEGRISVIDVRKR